MYINVSLSEKTGYYIIVENLAIFGKIILHNNTTMIMEYFDELDNKTFK